MLTAISVDLVSSLLYWFSSRAVSVSYCFDVPLFRRLLTQTANSSLSLILHSVSSLPRDVDDQVPLTLLLPVRRAIRRISCQFLLVQRFFVHDSTCVVILGKVRLGFSLLFWFSSNCGYGVRSGWRFPGHGCCTLAQPSIGLIQVGLSCSMEDERLDEGTTRVRPAIVDIRDTVQLPLQRFETRSSWRVRLPNPVLK